MLSSTRAMKPKLSLSISAGPATAAASSRPTLSLKSPITSNYAQPLRSPLSPLPPSPTARNTRLNSRGYSTVQQPTYAYKNSSASRSILKKNEAPRVVNRRIQFSETPTVNIVTPIEEDDYYGQYTKMSREERRWQRR